MKVLAQYFHSCIAVLKCAEVQDQFKNELKTVLHYSAYPGIAIIPLILFDWEVLIVPLSWILVIYLTRVINKEDLSRFEKFEKEVYKCGIIWIKISALVLSLFASMFGVEFLQFSGYLLKNVSLFPGDRYFIKSIIKWMAFIQYFSFYRAYLYIFMALGSYLNPKIKKINKERKEQKDKQEAQKSQ